MTIIPGDHGFLRKPDQTSGKDQPERELSNEEKDIIEQAIKNCV